MATLTTLNAGDGISPSRTVINTNFANLNSDKIETSVLDTDTTLAANSDAKVATQKAVKAYVDAFGNGDVAAAQVGGGQLGTPSTTNKFLTEDWWDSYNTTIPSATALQHSNDTTRTRTAGTYTKTKEILVPAGITITGATVTFDQRLSAGAAANTYSKIYKNGVAIGTERTTASGSFVSYSEDFTALNLVANDLLQLYVYNTGSGPITEVRNFRLYYERIRTGDTLTNQDP